MRTNEALVCYRTAEEGKTALADVSSIGKDEQIRANEDNKMKERIQIPMKTMPSLPQKKK